MGWSEDYLSLGASIGVISLSEHYSENNTICILNKDGSLWYEFTYFYDDSDGKFEYHNDKFRPIAFHPDQFLLAIRVVKEERNRFEVIVNEENTLHKYIENQPFLMFQTWEEHILSVPFVKFDFAINPLRENPGEKSVVIPYYADVAYYPAKIKGDWLQVRWMEEGYWNYGWIKWRKAERLLIKLLYIA
ncbi:hypothetical protein EDD80_1049 [Anseongella ginsenosidimutans]|uniref:Uncharacterized protein n=2 Tax=Anseongella ginsenosidimutans TaxID=496056 RepID=A0A4R3KRM0_9SPHI|nr:hypothetical protein EDD80_1049 [Anseongella ginsenosidimutans]